MNEKFKLVMQILKPKVKSLGFNAAELKSVAERLANNLTAADDADEDEIKAEIETAVTAAVPYLEMAQRNANRIIEDFRKKNKQTPKDENNDDDDQDDKDTPAYVKALLKKFEGMEERLNGLAESGRADSRKKKLEAIVKDAGSYGRRILKDFEGRKFDSDDAFDEYLDDIKTDIQEYATEMEQAGLKGMVHNGGGSNKGNKKEISDTDIDDIAATFN